MNSNKRLLIAETSTSTFSYHLRKVDPGEEKYGGGAGEALCGKAVGWDTKIPLSCWGKKDHLGSRYCQDCDNLAKCELMAKDDSEI